MISCTNNRLSLSVFFFFFYMKLQSLAVATLGDKQMAQRIDNIEASEEVKRFYLQVNYY